MTYLLCNGFCFCNDFWKNLIPLLDNKYEYYNENFVENKNEAYIGIGHSLGFLKLNNSGIKFKALIGLHGFLDFCGTENSKRAILQNTIDRMIASCKKNPRKFIDFFYSLCGYKYPPNYQTVLENNLISDLEYMKNAYQHCGAQTLIICSINDKVLNNEITMDNFKKRKNVELHYINNVNHTLGFSEQEKVFKLIRRFIEKIDE